MKIAALIARILLGLGFLVFGLNTYFMFIPMPKKVPPENVIHFMTAFMAKGPFGYSYMYAVAAFQVVGGLLLLTGRFAPLGLTLLGPVLVNILIFHTTLNTEGWQPGAVFAALSLFLLYYYRSAFAGLVRPYRATL